MDFFIYSQKLPFDFNILLNSEDGLVRLFESYTLELVFFKNLKNSSQETISQKHPAGFDLDGSDSIFRSNRFYSGSFHIFLDQGSMSFGVHGVQQSYWNIV